MPVNNLISTTPQSAGARVIRVQLPLALRDHTQGREEVAVAGDTVTSALANLVEQHPALRRHLYADNGALRGYVNVYLNEDDVRGLDDGTATRVKAGDTLMIVPSIAGG